MSLRSFVCRWKLYTMWSKQAMLATSECPVAGRGNVINSLHRLFIDSTLTNGYIFSPRHAELVLHHSGVISVSDQVFLDYAIQNKLTPFISMQDHHNLVYREEEREMFPTLKVWLYPSSPMNTWFRTLINIAFWSRSNHLVSTCSRNPYAPIRGAFNPYWLWPVRSFVIALIVSLTVIVDGPKHMAITSGTRLSWAGEIRLSLPRYSFLSHRVSLRKCGRTSEEERREYGPDCFGMVFR